MSTSLFRSSRIFRAAIRMVLLSAVLHIVLLLVVAVLRRDITILNYFDIIDVDLFMPSLAGSMPVTVISFVFLIAMYIVIFLIS